MLVIELYEYVSIILKTWLKVVVHLSIAYHGIIVTSVRVSFTLRVVVHVGQEKQFMQSAKNATKCLQSYRVRMRFRSIFFRKLVIIRLELFTWTKTKLYLQA